MRRALALAVLALLLLAAAYLLTWPVPFDPAAWSPPPAPALDGVYAPNDALSKVERFCDDALCAGPEDVAVAPDGRIYGGTRDGRIVVVDGTSGEPETLAVTGGRPLGLHFAAAGRLIVADAGKGLLSLDTRDGGIEVLATGHDDLPFAFTDDVDIASDGTIYFSDASWKFPQSRYYEDLFEHRPNGRLLAYEPQTGRTRLLLDGLYFANGVAVAPDDSFVLVVETWRYRIQRYWLSGPRAGTAEIFADNLPGFPDGISTGSAGRFWVAVFAPRNPLLDRLLPRPFLRRVLWRIPRRLRPQPVHHAFVLGLDGAGRPVVALHDTSPTAYAPITSVQEHGEHLYLGSLEATGFARIRTP